MDRRQFLASGSAAALTLPFVSTPLFAQAAGSGDAELNRRFEAIFQEQVRTNPYLATYRSLGVLAATICSVRLDCRLATVDYRLSTYLPCAFATTSSLTWFGAGS